MRVVEVHETEKVLVGVARKRGIIEEHTKLPALRDILVGTVL